MKMKEKIAIVGAGLLGRTIALELAELGFAITLFDRDNKEGSNSCAFAGAGMLAPVSELENADAVIFRLGQDAIAGWRKLITTCGGDVFFQGAGTLVVAHRRDRLLLERFHQRLTDRLKRCAKGSTGCDQVSVARRAHAD